jgi:hypothetical protein
VKKSVCAICGISFNRRWANFSGQSEPVGPPLGNITQSSTSRFDYSVDTDEGKKKADRERGGILANDLNVLALIKGAEHYIFVYDEASRPQVIEDFRDMAADPDLDLSWFDAMVLTKKAREQASVEEEPFRACRRSA